MHERFLLAALEQAWLGRGICSPNPSVGAVAVQNNRIIAQSSHQGAGSPHAEQLLLSQFDKPMKHVTLYVTLEPCNHWGRTPPCIDRIIESQVERVVYAYTDPNPIVASNDTPRLLNDAGIEVIHYPLPEIDRFYASYAHWVRTQKPWVTVKMAHTFDGKVSGEHGTRVMLSNEACHEFTHQQRMRSDVILTTSNTIYHDDPLLNVRTSLSPAVSKPVAILDRQLFLSQSAKVRKTAKRCHIFHDVTRQAPANTASCLYHGIKTVNGMLDLEQVLFELGQLGYHDVWVEAGPTLFNALHQANLVHRTYLYLVPKLLGQHSYSAYQDDAFFNKAHDTHWQAMDDNMVVTLDWTKA